MTTQAVASRQSRAFLKGTATFWFLVTLVGQWLFLAYIIAFYGGAILQGDLTLWNKNFSGAYVEGATVNNLAVVFHLGLSAIIHGLGPLQFIPALRRRAPTLHRWIGRSFFAALIITVPAGGYLLLARDIGELPLKIGFGIQMLLIVWFGWMAITRAIARDFNTHMRWAMRLFLAASAVWFFRVLLMAWLILSGGIGVDTSTGKGWMLDVMTIGQFTPLLILELYYASQRGGSAAKYAMGALLIALTLILAVGIALAFMFMWLPHF